MIVCTLIGPNPRSLTTSLRGAEVDKLLPNGGFIFRERRTGTLLRGRCLVNSTLVEVALQLTSKY